MTRTREENAADLAAEEARPKTKFKLVFTELKTLENVIEVEVEAADILSAAEIALDEYEHGTYDTRLEQVIPDTSACETRVGYHDADGIFVNLIS
jgi:hypothetical protein